MKTFEMGKRELAERGGLEEFVKSQGTLLGFSVDGGVYYFIFAAEAKREAPPLPKKRDH